MNKFGGLFPKKGEREFFLKLKFDTPILIDGYGL